MEAGGANAGAGADARPPAAAERPARDAPADRPLAAFAAAGRSSASASRASLSAAAAGAATAGNRANEELVENEIDSEGFALYDESVFRVGGRGSSSTPLQVRSHNGR